jgi:endonuclease YncB( thermonuclease family)
MMKWSWCAGALCCKRAAVLAIVTLLALDATATVGLAQNDRAQKRPARQRVDVPVDSIDVGDGDTVVIRWGEEDVEIVRILGIDTPETRNIAHNLPFAQPFGEQATAFARGAFAAATNVELLRADQMDPYGRTLGYLFINSNNFSVMVVRARLAAESVSHYGDNGFPEEAQAVLEAARAAGPLPFEPPFQYRRRMREVSEWMRVQGLLPSEDK